MGQDVLPGRYEILTMLDIPLEKVVIRHRSQRRRAAATLEEDRRLLIARHVGAGRPLLTNPDGSLPLLYRLDDHAVEGGDHVRLMTSETDYAEHLLTNVEHPEWRLVRGVELMADAIGVSAVLCTRDGVAVIGCRSGQTHEGAGALHVIPSGHPHPPQDIRTAFHAELRDELGIGPEELSREHLTGIVRALPSGKPELTARIVVDLDVAEVLERWVDAPERWEFDSVAQLEWQPSVVADWLGSNLHTCVAPGHAAMALAGRVDFGVGWFGRLMDRLVRSARGQ